jgi:hypothetical protein
MNSIVSWAIFLAVLGGLSWHYAGRPNFFTRFGSKEVPQKSLQQATGPSTRKPKAKAKRAGGMENVQNESETASQVSSNGANASKKRKIATPQFRGAENASTSDPSNDTNRSATMSEANEYVTNNADFAREMEIARAGTQFTASSKPGISKKERRAKKQGTLRPNNATDSPSLSTGPSSTTGADADDDLSPVASPPLPATSTAATSKSGDVSDMLEPSSAGPSILRLTDPINPTPKAKLKQVSKTIEQVETKKQRQQRTKREAQRVQVEEAERERRRLMEKQLRGARMAEGTSAQSKTAAFKPPPENAWFSRPSHPSLEINVETPSRPSALLDTFEPPTESATSMTAERAVAPFASGTDHDISTEKSRPIVGVEKDIATSGKDGKDWAKDLPIEEEQIRLIQDSEDSWTTVSKRDKKKASKSQVSKENDTSETSGVEIRHDDGIPSKNGASSRPAYSSSSNSYHQLGDSGFQDSDWAA